MFKILTPLISCLPYLNAVTSTLPTSNSNTTNTHQLDNGKDSVVTATTNNNNNAIIIRRMRVNIVFILYILI